MNCEQEFEYWFEQAIGKQPYPFQIRFACEQTTNCPKPTHHQKENTNA